jgi:regulator of PEP synthase PpsR (kinase-PPPase family)
MVLDVSGRAIEETATIILETMKDREEKKYQTELAL